MSENAGNEGKGGVDRHASDDDPLLSRKEAAALVSRDPKTIERWEKSKRLKRAGHDRRRGVLYRRSHVRRAERITRRARGVPVVDETDPRFTPEQVVRFLEHRAKGKSFEELVRLEGVDPFELERFFVRFDQGTHNYRQGQLASGAFLVTPAGVNILAGYLHGPAIVDEASLIESVRKTVDAKEGTAATRSDPKREDDGANGPAQSAQARPEFPSRQ